ncbi:rhombosortase [Halothiobacillus diazotrophicus]|uniref:Rhombosortase n=1 Tax=Halothiobacillus diazotrophicus TaxID=1860122 RepID=A0A191ZHS6_9GAMM|nr:rhombosortase [Halothiobacillus diazotrophicus]ANJ67398.1 rhombosortase [Halothiobacillus diazotrophicus]
MTESTHKWLISLTVAALTIAILFFHGGHWFRFDRGDIFHGQIWRILTANFTEGNGRQLVVDLAGLMIWTLLAAYLETARTYVILLLGTGLAIGLALLWFDPRIGGYIGLSGILHGLFAASAIRLISRREWLGGLSLLTAVALKIYCEQHLGDLALARLLDVPTVLAPHLYGAVAGAAIALALLLFRR